jgi:predicted Zn-dependent peptidase
MLDRKIQPQINPLQTFSKKSPEMSVLSNGVPIFKINYGDEDIVRIDWIFTAGSALQSQKLVALFTNQLIKSGSKKMTSAEIAETFDFYGAVLQFSCSYHYSYVTLYALSKHLSELLPLLSEILQNANFPESEFKIYSDIRKKKYLVESGKVQFLAQRKFISSIYGKDNIYGRCSELADYEKLNTELFVDFYKKHYLNGICKIVVCGKISNQTIRLIDDVFGSENFKTSQTKQPEYDSDYSSENGRILIEKENAVQSCVFIGKRLFNYHHLDYHKFAVLNAILGGYFGSRLMSNIREEKGYTYGINSATTHHLNDGHFFITTQCGVGVVEPLIKEVYFEMERLQNDLIKEDELNMVRNFMIGEQLRIFDSGLNLSDHFIPLHLNEFDFSFYDKSSDAIQSITPQEIRNLAQKYFDKDSFVEVIAGKIG